MHHEEEERHQERHGRPHRRPQQHPDQQNFRSRWEEPRPFRHEHDRRRFEEDERRARAEYEHRMRQQQNQPTPPNDINSHQHGFSEDHHTMRNRDERREWRDGSEYYRPENQHARDRWQQPEDQPPLRERRRRQRDDGWEERGW